MAKDPLGAVRAVVRRRWTPVWIGTCVLLVCLGALVAWNFAIGNEDAPVGVAIVVLLAVVSAWTYARTPKAIEVREEGLWVAAPLAADVWIAWTDVEVGRVSIARVGKRPRVVQLRSRAGVTLALSDAQYTELGVLIELALRRTNGAVRDDRLR